MDLCQTIYKLNWILRILWKEQSSHPHPQRYILELKKGCERQKDKQSSSTKDELNQDLLTWKRRQLRRIWWRPRIFFLWKIISSTENMAYFIFSGMKLAGKINELVFQQHDGKSWNSLLLWLRWQKFTEVQEKSEQVYGSDTHQAVLNTKMPDSMSP